MRNSDNTDPLFVSVRPDWSQAVKTTLTHQTMVNATKAGLEQRERGRRYSTMRIAFTRRGLTLVEWQARFERVLAEMQTVCVVPFWNEGLDAVRRHSGTNLRVQPGRRLRVSPTANLIVCNEFWRVLPSAAFRSELWSDSPYVYVSNGVTGYFAAVLQVKVDPAQSIRARPGGSVMARSLPFSRLLVRTARVGIIGAPPPTEGFAWDEVRIYPCFECRRIPDSEDLLQSSMQSRDETLIFETL